MHLTIQQTIDGIYRTESRRVFATLVRLLGDFDRAEEALQDAFTAAAEQWVANGLPENPRTWLISTGRFRAIDAMRRQGRLDQLKQEVANRINTVADSNALKADVEIEDDQLRLIFTCCHPAIDPNIQVALTLREVCGLTTEEIANAFLTSPATLAQRIVRGKTKIRDAAIPYIVPTGDELQERVESVLAVIYLVFNEGYSASSGDSLTRADLSNEAIRLGRLLIELLPHPEAIGLLALMLLQESRREARMSKTGDIVLLEEQDRSRWNAQYIREGQSLIDRAVASRRFGAYTLQAAIASIHSQAATAAQTDWHQITLIYDALYAINPTPVVELNRAVAFAMRDGPEVGLNLIDAILDQGVLHEYHLAHAARADMCRRLGRIAEARTSYERALRLAKQEPERRFLRCRLANL